MFFKSDITMYALANQVAMFVITYYFSSSRQVMYTSTTTVCSTTYHVQVLKFIVVLHVNGVTLQCSLTEGHWCVKKNWCVNIYVHNRDIPIHL